MFGPSIIAYLFLGGASAGGFFAMATWSLLEDKKSTSCRTSICSQLGVSSRPSTVETRFAQAFLSLQAYVYLLSFVLLILAILLLFWDLGTPENLLYIFIRPQATILNFGACCLAIETLIGLLLILSTLFNLRLFSRRTHRIIESLCCVFSLATMVYTGMYLASNSTIALWDTWLIVAVFLLSSLSCGITLMLLVDYFIKDQTLLLRAARPLQKCHLACLVAEALFLTLFVARIFTDPAVASARTVLLSPDMLATAVIGVAGFGILAPALLESYALMRQECRTIPLSDVLCLVGGLLLRYCIITCGVH